MCPQSTSSEIFIPLPSFPGVSRLANKQLLSRVMQDDVLILYFDYPPMFNDVYL